jgi:hypothetical protein
MELNYINSINILIVYNINYISINEYIFFSHILMTILIFVHVIIIIIII